MASQQPNPEGDNMKARQFTRVAAAVVALTLLAGACGSDERIAATGD